MPSNSLPKVLVTGGAGFFGSLLVEQLLARGHSCVILDIADDAVVPPAARYIPCDIRDADGVRAACRDIDIIQHNVAQVPLAKDNKAFESVNIDGVRNLLQAASEAGVKKVVYTSSSAVYGVPRQNPVLETHEPKPEEPYGVAKYRGELLCHEFTRKGLDVSIVRPRTIMGHGRLGIFQILFEWIREGRNVPVLGNGANLYQFVHAHDLARACILAGERPGGKIYNCGATEFGSMRSVLEDLCKHAGTGSKVVSVPMGLATFGMNVTSLLGLSPLGPYHSLMYGRSMYFDSTEARQQLGWEPRYSNNEMFRETYDWYIANRESVMRNVHGHSPHRSPLKQGVLGIVKRVI
jgi:nucleoside-diphosphate-sugar epimerase